MNNVVIWARVSSREQREGYSIDAQLRLAREKAAREGWPVLREFVVAESARRGAEREAFNAMYKWVRSNARREQIGHVLSHKLDRICRNIRDAVRMQELEDLCGVRLAFVDNQFGAGAAGALSFNVMAAVAQYYSDNLRSEVIKGIDERTRQGWPPGKAPFGYQNVKGDRTAPVQPHPTNIRAVQRIFELYSSGTKTFAQIGDILASEGYVYRPCEPRFGRTVVAAILDNRFYIGQLVRNGEVYPGKYPTFVDEMTFERCQQIKRGKNRRTGSPELYLAGGLFQCAVCGYSITGERVRRPFRDGRPREYFYYRCGSIEKAADHPPVRWRSQAVEDAIVEHLQSLRLTSPVAREWYRRAALSAFESCARQSDHSLSAMRRRLGEIKTLNDRLLGLCLSDAIDEGTFRAKKAELDHEAAGMQSQVKAMVVGETATNQSADSVVTFLEQPAELWLQAGAKQRREILAALTASRRFTGSELIAENRPPFGWTVRANGVTASPGEVARPAAAPEKPGDTESCFLAVQHHPGLTACELAVASGIAAHTMARRLPTLRQRGKLANGDARVCRVKHVVSQTWVPASEQQVSAGTASSPTASLEMMLSISECPLPDSIPIDGWISPRMIAIADAVWISPGGAALSREQSIDLHRNAKRLMEVLQRGSCAEDHPGGKCEEP